MKQNEYVIAIPTYNRPETIKNKTLNVLERENFPKNRIHIFFANELERDQYNLGDEYPNQIIGTIGLCSQRNFIVNHFDHGQKILWMDDDLMNFYGCEIDPARMDKRHNLRLKPETIKNIAEIGFDQLLKNECTLFGVYPVTNAGFMKMDHITTDLRYIIGCFYGTINIRETYTFDVFENNGGAKEDFLRSVMAYQNDGSVVRLNMFNAETIPYNEAGGLQSIDQFGSRYDRDMISMNYICDRFPQMAFRNITRKNYPEIRLTDKRIKNNINQTTLF